jgi:allantoicase
VDLVQAERAVTDGHIRPAAVAATNVTVMRVQAYPDGGFARIRAFGRPTEDGVAQLESMWKASA